MANDIERISYNQIEHLIDEKIRKTPHESIDIYYASGRYLAMDVLASKSLPPYDVSEKDGFAVFSRALAGATPSNPVCLDIVDTIRPGNMAKIKVRRRNCVKILTGAYVPRGADAVVMQEDVQLVDTSAKFTKSIAAGANIFRAGSDIKKGELLFKKGHRLSLEDVFLLASAGISKVKVTRKLKIAVLATGDELTSDPRASKDGFVLDTNRPVIMDHLNTCGFLAVDAGLARDDISDISCHIRRTLPHVDALITTGGSSVSKADLVSESLKSMNAERLFHGIKLRPSSTAGISMYRSKPIFILSGLIQSCLVALYAVVIPSLRSMIGLGYTYDRTMEAKIAEDFQVTGEYPFQRAVWVRINNNDGTLYATPTPASSHSKSILRSSHGFFLGESGSKIVKGSRVQIIIVKDPTRP